MEWREQRALRSERIVLKGPDNRWPGEWIWLDFPARCSGRSAGGATNQHP